jgi:hypothetical protein
VATSSHVAVRWHSLICGSLMSISNQTGRAGRDRQVGDRDQPPGRCARHTRRGAVASAVHRWKAFVLTKTTCARPSRASVTRTSRSRPSPSPSIRSWCRPARRCCLRPITSEPRDGAVAVKAGPERPAGAA